MLLATVYVKLAILYAINGRIVVLLDKNKR